MIRNEVDIDILKLTSKKVSIPTELFRVTFREKK